ncbi:SPFH domain-containing protein [Actomonas aquatica]|uniref:SPFH domain-containing protein n=1 Tax=Actomonas aquatica TaxID=2866162 RepID=A0ABZ1CE71_9BACT|nr:SPFH domain-containing protein [Opitutus sp. WL0086]WRQ89982.1 SPFH domain-containing protein [Opitutus sp. WL0086]
MKQTLSLIATGVIVVVLILASIFIVDIETVEGNQLGVKETWSGGVLPDPLQPKTYVLFPGFTQKVFKYDMSSQVFVMNDQSNDTYGAGRRRDSYLVQSSEGQDMRISLNIRWRRDPSFVVELHKTVRENVEEKILRPELMRVVKDQATTRSALDAYSGEGLVSLQSDISAALMAPDAELRKRGVIVENFVIEHIGLDPSYVEQIKARQVAVQSRLRAIEETKAAEAKAEQAKAEAQAAYERAVVDARRDKEVGVLSAQKMAEQQVLDAEAAAKRVELAAEADKNRNVLAAQGEQEAALLRAQAIKALGEAEAEATRLKLSAYSAEGSEAFVRIEVAKSMSDAFKNIDGYLPQDMTVNLLSDSFLRAVKSVVGGEAAAADQVPMRALPNR